MKSNDNNKLDLSRWPTKERKILDYQAYSEGWGGLRLEKMMLESRKNSNEGCFLLVNSLFHLDIAEQLYMSCCETLIKYGVAKEKIITEEVPGSFELPYTIARYARTRGKGEIAAAIALGCVIQGKTRHFDYVCSGSIDALSRINAEGNFPVVLGVLTTNSLEEASERADPEKMNKGRDFALTALWMANQNH